MSDIKKYLLVTFTISWTSWIMLIALCFFNFIEINSPFYLFLYVLGGFGPTIGGLLSLNGKISAKRYFNFIFTNLKKGSVYLLISAVLTIIFFIVVSSGESISSMSIFSFLYTWLMMAFILGGNEEIGWRARLFDLINTKESALKACLVTTVIWIIWHLPIWIMPGVSKSQSFLNFIIFSLCFSIYLTALYIKSKSVFATMLLHGLVNTCIVFFKFEYNLRFWIISFLLSALGVYVILKEDSHAKKDTY